MLLPHKPQSLTYRPDIDGLRAIAVLAVVFYHAGLPGFSGGFVGVDIFFVISGFLITNIIQTGLKSGEFSLADFYLRRIKRLFPALFAVLAVSSAAAYIMLIPSDFVRFGESLQATVLFTSNFYWQSTARYFADPAIYNPLLHTWSLAVEEQFYVVWPVTLLLLNRPALSGKKVYLMAALGLVSIVITEFRLSADFEKDAFFFPWCRWWELLTGALIAISPPRITSKKIAAILAALGLAAIAASFALYDSSTRFPGLAAVLPCLGAALLIALGRTPNFASELLAWEPARWIGSISYSLYLIHWPLFSFAHLYLTAEPPVSLRAGLILTSIGLAYLSWRFIEIPFRTAQMPAMTVFGGAATAAFCLLLAGNAIVDRKGFPSRAGGDILAKINGLKSPEGIDSKYCRRVSLDGLKGGQTCEIGKARDGRYDFVLWGDSHARHFLPAIATLAGSQNMPGLLVHQNACRPFLEEPHTSKGCRDFNASVRDWLKNNPVKFVILAGRWRNYLKQIRGFTTEAKPELNAGGLAKTLAFLNSQNIEVTVLDQTPDFPIDVRLCVARALFFERSSESCVTEPVSRFTSWHQDIEKYFTFLSTQYRFTVASGDKAFCAHDFCSARAGDTLLMTDENHLSEAGALRAAPYLHIPFFAALPSEALAGANTKPLGEGAPAL